MNKHSTTPKTRHGAKLATITTLVVVLLSACSSGPSPQPKTRVPPPVETPPEQEQMTRDRFSPQYQAPFYQIEDQLAQGDWQSAQTGLEQLDPRVLTARDNVQWQRLMAKVHFLQGKTGLARHGLQALLAPTTDSDLYLAALHDLQHQLRLAGRNLTSAELAHRASQTHSDLLTPELLGDIWTDLQSTPAQQLAASTNTTPDPTWTAWLSLAQLSAGDHEHGVGEYVGALTQWQREHPEHPASVFLPGGLEQLMNAPQARAVALLLPLSGRLAGAGAAVRDGYLAQYFHHQQGTGWDVHIIDTQSYPSIEDAYHDAEQLGADIVIGPLDKSRVSALASYTQRSLPVIALNRIEELPTENGRALVQLALAPKDEARQLARIAFGQGHRRAMIVGPQNSWGERMATALQQQWQDLGGNITTRAIYQGNADLSASIEKALNIKSSQRRGNALARSLGTDLEFSPQRRHDIDVVFMLTNTADQARSIKPLLAYHYADDLPVMTTSAIYQGKDGRNRDLAGVNLLQYPWRLEATNPTRDALGEAGQGRLAALYALGADAYLLQTRFAQLGAGKYLRLRGDSGNLALNEALQIVRTLQRATFDGAGNVKAN